MNKNLFYNQHQNIIRIAKHLIIVISIIIVAGTLLSCKKKIATIKNAIAIVSEKNIPYLVNTDGEKLSLAEYDTILPIFDDYIGVAINNQYGFINSSGELVVQLKYDYVFPMKEDMAVVIESGNYFIINSNGSVLYTFEDGVSSSSYFSENRLIIEKNGLFSYLYYNEENDTFNYLTDKFYYYCERYINGYAVIGELDGNNDEIKYTFLKSNGELLFQNTWWDFADSFYDGWARVADKVTKYLVTTGNTTVLMYRYINSSGDYLRNITNSQIIEVEYACNFSDGFALTANYIFHSGLQTYYKSFSYFNKSGDPTFDNAIYYSSGESPNAFFPGKMVNVGNTHVFRVGGNSGSWAANYYFIDTDTGKYQFGQIEWVFGNDEQWIIDKAEKYSISNNVKVDVAKRAIINFARSPITMDEFKASTSYQVATPISAVRIYDGYIGLIKITYNTANKKYYASFIIPPIYDYIIY